ncbi:MAG: hypothetical protein HQM10_22370 [Candidatus Riflebacteria bacterium]|nr:hypothetical protein [Candidatus Riflebacteria bacterium]
MTVDLMIFSIFMALTFCFLIQTEFATTFFEKVAEKKPKWFILLLCLISVSQSAWAGPYTGSGIQTLARLIYGTLTLLVAQFIMQMWLAVKYRRFLSTANMLGLLLLAPAALGVSFMIAWGCSFILGFLANQASSIDHYLVGFPLLGPFLSSLFKFETPYFIVFFPVIYFANKHVFINDPEKRFSFEDLRIAFIVPLVCLIIAFLILIQY